METGLLHFSVSVLINGTACAAQAFDAPENRRYQFGRSAGNDIVIEYASVGRQHGTLFASGGRLYVADNHSTNGMYVNGAKVADQPVALRPGDTIALDSHGGAALRIDSVSAAGAVIGGVRRQPPRRSAPAPRPGVAVTAPYRPAANGPAHPVGRLQLLVLDGRQPPRVCDIPTSGSNLFTIGRDTNCSIQVLSPLASLQHAELRTDGGVCYVTDCGSTNGVLLNGRLYRAPAGAPSWIPVYPGDILRIDTSEGPLNPNGVLMTLSAGESGAWRKVSLAEKNRITIGRDPGCDVVLPHIGVSRSHACIERVGAGLIIEDHSTNGTFLNGTRVFGRQPLPERSAINIAAARLYLTGDTLFYAVSPKGLTIETNALTRVVRDKGGEKRILDNVSLRIHPHEFVAIVGGSGCGKSTLLNAMTGYDRATSGSVTVNGESLYDNYDCFKSIMGYVPQQDIVHEHLTLSKMLYYTAKLRMPEDTTEAEREKRVTEVLRIVELTDFRDYLIRKLSGGQKKRASIAVELLADPGLFFLDEPTSGLDPGTERNLMHMLRSLADKGGKTVVMVTHTTLNLHLCDKIIFMGKGGKLCFCGSPDEAKQFFGVDNFVDIYDKINEDTTGWTKKFRSFDKHTAVREKAEPVHKRTKRASLFRQLGILAARYINLLMNDRARTLLLLIEPVVLAAILKVCTADSVYTDYFSTKNMLFTFTCCGIWIGLFNSIQEICKERVILKREYMANLRLTSYIGSKFLVQSLLSLLQACLLFFTYALLAGLPESSVWDAGPVPEMLLTTFLIIQSSSCLGLVVSAFSKNADRAMTLAPFLLVIQLVFAGIIFELDGVVKTLSYVTISRWAISAFGTTTNLESMYPPLMPGDKTLDLFPFTEENILKAWLVLAGFSVLYCVLAGVVLRRVKKDSR